MQQLKRIIIGLPATFDFYILIAEQLRRKGFEVIDISYKDHDFRYRNFSQKLYNFFRKTFLNDKHYKNKLRFSAFESEVKNKLEHIEGKADYALLIRADVYPLPVIKQVKARSEKLIGYQWDGLNRYPAIKDYIPCFDRFFVFDKDDLREGVLPLTNFYFKTGFEERGIKKEDKTVFFLGSYEKSRMEQINAFSKKIKALGYRPRFQVFIPPGKAILPQRYGHLEFFFERISYKEYLEKAGKADVIVDFLNQKHNGLSFRVFEALGYDKKTDNR